MSSYVVMPGDKARKPNLKDFLAYESRSASGKVQRERPIDEEIDALHAKLKKFNTPKYIAAYPSHTEIKVPAAFDMIEFIRDGKMEYYSSKGYLSESILNQLELGPIPNPKTKDKKELLEKLWEQFVNIRNTQFFRDRGPLFKYYIKGGQAVVAHLLGKNMDPAKKDDGTEVGGWPDIWAYFSINPQTGAPNGR